MFVVSPKKGDVLEDEAAYEEALSKFYFMLYGVEDKDELLSKYDIDVREKLRTYFAGDFYGITWQKFLYTQQNEAMKKRCETDWVQYGYVKQFGGYSRLMARLIPFNLKWVMDISGWDRFFPFLCFVYTLRNFFLTQSVKDAGITGNDFLKFEYIRDQVTGDIVAHRVILKDGSIWIKEIGNPSGSNNTTEDNCIGHVLLDVYIFIKLFERARSKLPSSKKLMKYCLALIFGDDDACGVNTMKYLDSTPEEVVVYLEEVIDSCLSECGFTKKFLYYETGFGPVKTVQEGGQLEFLGSKPLKTRDGIVPKPNISHLAASLTTNMKAFSVESTISKLRAALDLCLIGQDDDAECKLVVEFCVDACRYIWSIKEDLDIEPTDQKFLLLAATRVYNSKTLVTGFESGRNRHLVKGPFSFFLGSPFSEDGWNKSIKTVCNLSPLFSQVDFMSKAQLKARRDGQTINRLQNELAKQKRRERRNFTATNAVISTNKRAAASMRVNADYQAQASVNLASAIVDPGGTDPSRMANSTGVRTAVIRSKLQFFVPFALIGDVEEFELGSFYIEAHPDGVQSVIYLQEIDSTITPAVAHVMSGKYTAGYNLSNFYGLYQGDRRVDDMITFQQGTYNYYDIVCPIMSADGAPQQTIFSDGLGSYPVGNYYPPCFEDPGTGVYTSRARVAVIGITPSTATFDGDIFLEQIDNQGTVLATALVAGWNGASTALTIDLVDTPLAWRSWKLRLRMTAGNSELHTMSLTSVDMSYAAAGVRYVNQPLPTLGDNIANFEQYRVNAWSMWLQYIGASLTNAGSLVAVRYDGGPPAGHTGLFDYNSIAAHPLGYSGLVKSGAYGWGNYLNPAQRNLRPLQAQIGTKLPYLIFTGRYAGDNSGNLPTGNTLKCEVFHHFEFTSRSQSYTYRPGLSDSAMMDHLHNSLAYMPSVMENTLHMRTIKQFLRKMAQKGKQGLQLAWNNRDTIAKVVEAASPLLPLAM
jgi:hypothetical protein